MDQTTPSNQRRKELDIDLRDELLKVWISRERTTSRRLLVSASNLTSFREDQATSFTDTPFFSSTPCSPVYTSTDYIDPATYSFTAALKALQARYRSRDSLLPIRSLSNGNCLHSKWNEAERYISNPFSGKVPIECLSSKTLSGRTSAHSIATSENAPVVFSHARITQATSKPQLTAIENCRKIGTLTRDVGTQSTPPDLSSTCTSPDSALHIKEISQISCGMERQKPNFCDQPKSQENEVDGSEKQKGQRNRKGEGNQAFKCKLGLCSLWIRKEKKENKKQQPQALEKVGGIVGKT